MLGGWVHGRTTGMMDVLIHLDSWSSSHEGPLHLAFKTVNLRLLIPKLIIVLGGCPLLHLRTKAGNYVSQTQTQARMSLVRFKHRTEEQMGVRRHDSLVTALGGDPCGQHGVVPVALGHLARNSIHYTRWCLRQLQFLDSWMPWKLVDWPLFIQLSNNFCMSFPYK